MKIILGKNEIPQKRWTVRWLWEPRDIWIGVFWNAVNVNPAQYDPVWNFYICLIPCLPIVISKRPLL